MYNIFSYLFFFDTFKQNKIKNLFFFTQMSEAKKVLCLILYLNKTLEKLSSF